ncbi:MAG TPA: PD-(D/E)XK nuclease family protein [Candidatus Baltobacteraceae bacterium]|nr:PD-(D/E)XK nuclease family protein [Candidatus Baltobacteraceae bacterium]
MESAEHRAFLAAAAAWSRSRDESYAARLLRSPLSGVPHEVAGAYVTLWARARSLLELISRERVACGMEARETLIAFTAALREAKFEFDSHETALPAATSDGEFALLEPLAPEAASGVRTHNPRFSASQLNTYVECPRKWYYRYLCAAIEDRGSSASFYGTAFHAALEDLHAEFPQPAEASPEELDRKLQGYVNAAFDRHRNLFETPVEYELQRRRATRTARKYVEWLVSEAKRAPFTVVGCELSAELQIDGYDFIGYIDRLDRDDRTGAVTVIDYKTGSIAMSAAEYREKVRQFRDFQLPFYYWARTAQGDRVSRLALVPLKDALLDVRPIALEVVPVPADVVRSQSPTGVIPIGELERARDRMLELCAELTSGKTASFPVSEDPSACQYCVYKTACAGRPYPEEERFAR